MKDQGFPAPCWRAELLAKRFENVGGYKLYRIASNLVNGWPLRYVDHDNGRPLPNGGAA
jgi:hypothetical protein